MNNLSNIELKQFIHDCQIEGNHRLANTLYELLAYRKASREPVAWRTRYRSENCVGGWGCIDAGIQFEPAKGHEMQALYAALPQTVNVPMQPLAIDSSGTLRFKENQIVRKLLDFATANGYGLNEMALDDYTDDDRMQLAQLIGYSLSGYAMLSYVTDESFIQANKLVPHQGEADGTTAQYESLSK